MPDVLLIPAIASFFEVSTDELFDYSLYETEKRIEAIVDEYSKCRGKSGTCKDPERCEEILREGLKNYPGNDILLNCLIGTIPLPKRAEEVIEIGKQLVQATRRDEIRIDAYRIMAEAYKSLGDDSMCKESIEKIPEVYFSNLYVKAALLEGDDKYETAVKEKHLCLEHLIDMLYTLADHYELQGEKEKAKTQLEIARSVLKAFENDFSTEFTRCAYDPEEIDKISKRIASI